MKKVLMCLLGVGVSLSMLTTGFAEEEKKAEKKRPEPAAVFKRLDKDGDKKVSKAEFLAARKTEEAKQKAETQFTRRDKDKDGFLSQEEFIPKTDAKKPGDKKPGNKKPEKKPE